MNGIILHSEHRPDPSWRDGGVHLPAPDMAEVPTVWSVPVPDSHTLTQHFIDTLSAEEINRGSRFHQARHRNRFLLGRVVLRHLLGRALAIAPRSLQFKLGMHNKPFLDGVKQPLSFSLSYTDNHVIIAIAPLHAVGIDIEHIKTDFEFESMVDACFSPREIQYIGEEHRRFYTLWTRKEAVLKLTGKGIGEHLPDFEVLDGSGAVQPDNVGTTATDRLHLFTFEVQPTLLATLCTSRPFDAFACYRWQEPGEPG